MFVVTEAEAAAIRAVYEQRGEFSAAVELRRLFPAVTDTAQARACARTIAGWKPLPVPLRPVRRDPTPKLAPTACQASANDGPGISLVVSLPMALLSFADSTPRAYWLKAGNAARATIWPNGCAISSTGQPPTRRPG